MDAELPHYQPIYQPDAVLRKRQEEQAAKPKPAVTVEKPVSFRVMKTRPGTRTKHYSKKPRQAQQDKRYVKFY